MLFQIAPLALTYRVTLRDQIEVKHISEGCYLETLADRGMVTIKVE